MQAPVIPDLGGLGAQRAQQAFRDRLIAREATLRQTLAAGALAALLLLWLPTVAVVLNVLLASSVGATSWVGPGGFWGVVIATARAAWQYGASVAPWMPLAAGFGALLGWLRRVSARRNQWWVLPLGPGQGLPLGWQTVVAALLVPLALLVVALRPDRASIGGNLLIVFLPAWLLSGLVLEAFWEMVVVRLLRRLAPLSPALELGLIVQGVLRMEPELQTADFHHVTADPATGTVHVRGVFVNAEQMRRVQQVCQKVAVVRRVEVTSAQPGVAVSRSTGA